MFFCGLCPNRGDFPSFSALLQRYGQERRDPSFNPVTTQIEMTFSESITHWVPPSTNALGQWPLSSHGQFFVSLGRNFKSGWESIPVILAIYTK